MGSYLRSSVDGVEGLRAAWSAEVLRCGDGWWAYALHVAGGDAHAAEDLVQEVLARVIGRGLMPGDVSAGYVYRAIRNGWVGDRRRAKVKARILKIVGGADGVSGSSGFSGCSAFAKAEGLPGVSGGHAALWRAIGVLSDEQREVVLLKHGGGLTLEQVGVVTDRPLGTVAGQYRRALIALRAELVDEKEEVSA